VNTVRAFVHKSLAVVKEIGKKCDRRTRRRVQARRSRSALRANQNGRRQARRCLANAGIPNLAPFGKITEEQYDSVFNGNVKGLLFTVQKALPLLPDGASIILNASIVASKGLPDWSVYSATKAAVRSFARTWTTDLKDAAYV